MRPPHIRERTYYNTMDKREKNFTVRLTLKEYEYLKQEAAKLSLTVAAYIRLKAVVMPLESEVKQ